MREPISRVMADTRFRWYLTSELKFRHMVSWLLSLNYTVQADKRGKVARVQEMPGIVFGLDKLSEISEYCNLEEEAVQMIQTSDDSYNCVMDATYMLFECSCFKCKANQRGKK